MMKPKLRLRCRIMIQTMPMGNSMPMVLPKSTALAAAASAATQAEAVSAVDSDNMIVVDAHTVKDLTLEAAIPNISRAIPIVLSSNEIHIRKQIATKVQMTMGADIKHFEKDIDPRTGIVDVDWDITPIDPDNKLDAKIMSHAVFRTYCQHENSVDVPTEERVFSTSREIGQERTTRKNPEPVFNYLLGCEAVHLPALMQHVIDVNTGKVDPATQREYDFPLQTNFCTTFNICTVLPFEKPLSHAEIQQMQNELDIFKGGLAAYEMEVSNAKKEGRKLEPKSNRHMFVTSPLKHLPDVETMVRLQQGLQQMYVSNLVRSSDILLREKNSMAYVAAGTCEQLHRQPICFHDATEISRKRIVALPARQVAVQMHSAMCNLGMTMDEFANMRDPDHAFLFLKTMFSAGTQDGRQTPYKSDFVLHSVTPVSKAVAVANLQPVPGKIEYVPGCPACFYRRHVLDTGKEIFLRRETSCLSSRFGDLSFSSSLSK